MRYRDSLQIMLNIVIIVFACVLIPSYSVLAQDSNSTKPAPDNSTVVYDMKQCIDRGLEVSPQIRAAKYKMQKAASERKGARSGFFPDLSASASYQDLNSLEAKGRVDPDYIDQDIGIYSVQLRQTLFAGFTVLNSLQKAELKKQLARAQKKQTEMKLIQQIQYYFLELQKAKQEIGSLNQAIERLEVNQKSAQSYFDVQMAPYLQVLQAEVDLADAKQQLSKAKNKKKQYKTQLNVLLDLSGKERVHYEGDLKNCTFSFGKDMKDCLEYALDNRPQIRVAQKSMKMAEEEVDIAQGKFYPRVNADLNYYVRDNDYDEPRTTQTLDPDTGERRTVKQSRDQENTYWSGSVKLQWKFNTGGREYYRHETAQNEVLRLEQQLKQTLNQVEIQVKTSYNSLKEAKSRIRSTKKALEGAQESYNRARQRLENEMGTISQVLDAQARLRRAEANYNQALADYKISLAELYYSMGKKKELLN